MGAGPETLVNLALWMYFIIPIVITVLLGIARILSFQFTFNEVIESVRGAINLYSFWFKLVYYAFIIYAVLLSFTGLIVGDPFGWVFKLDFIDMVYQMFLIGSLLIGVIILYGIGEKWWDLFKQHKS